MNCIKIAEDTVKSHRDKLGVVPEVLPVSYKGLQMTVDEAWAVVRAFEKKKGTYFQRLINILKLEQELQKLSLMGLAEQQTLLVKV